MSLNVDGLTIWTAAETPDGLAAAVQELADEVAQAARQMDEVYKSLESCANRSTEYWRGTAADNTRAQLEWVTSWFLPELQRCDAITEGLRTFATQLPDVASKAKAILAELDDPRRNLHSLTISPSGSVSSNQMFFGSEDPEVKAAMAECDAAIAAMQQRVNAVTAQAVDISDALYQAVEPPDWPTDSNPALDGYSLANLDAEGQARADLDRRTRKAPPPAPQALPTEQKKEEEKGPLAHLLDTLTRIVD
ncbi:hypothetical protein TH66_00155 [Carbonactinospora thermoautotrophica]|uniref:Uncharacterized protein n=1 Tax=Carbonactinospora thermoautotrophica TaxID=1469144 RepID=A0A132N3H3_9ACTN|nr:hypothetical protein [Carbonactinospora thermoautotrophica]KWX04634.1 hypothetical protein TR74_24240 [Carbonactinospora thermoautotrophica]KWX05966.1 hypothetical protein TH66_00155 [Carbonactinospora thermoautotrophica]